MFDMRCKEDIMKDISILNDICNEYKNYQGIVRACLEQCNIKEIKVCKCSKNKNLDNFEERLNCKICKGTGYEIIFKKDKKENDYEIK